MDATKILGKSLRSMGSFGMKSDMSQNSAPAPTERRQKIVIGDMYCPLVRSLQMIMLKPNMAYAVKHARWPMIESLLIISLFTDFGMQIYSFLIYTAYDMPCLVKDYIYLRKRNL